MSVELWDSWTAVSDTEILLDGRKLLDVFSSIKNQLDYLKNKQDMLIFNQNRGNIELAPALERYSSVSNIVQPKADNVIDPTATIRSDELQFILQKIKQLEADSKKYPQFEERIEKLEKMITVKTSNLQAQIDQLSIRIDSSSLNEVIQERKIADLESCCEEKINDLTKTLEDKLQRNSTSSVAGINQQQIELGLLKDVVQLNEFRLKNIEISAIKNQDATRDLKDAVDYFPIKYIDNIKNDIIELYMDKASKTDLALKADINLSTIKADQTEITRLENHAVELDRRFQKHTVDVADGFNTIDLRLEKRMDKVAQWCLKHLKRELKSMNFPVPSDEHLTPVNQLHFR